MKSVLISIKPKWCELIASGKKTIEVRKTKPKLDTPFKCYIYETKTQDYYSVFHDKTMGKVVGEFVCDYILGRCESSNADIAEQQGFVKREKIFEYSQGKEVFGWHISDLVIYDEPKEFWQFCHPCMRQPGCDCEFCKAHFGNKPILRPPQSWCYVEEKE